MTSPAVHSEDDNFIVGSGDNYDRLRRDARQLHLSKHNETRSKAHFARFRNSALKCSMEATQKRVDQEKSLTLRDLERAQAELLKRQQKYDSKKVSYLPNITTRKKRNSVNSKASLTTPNRKIVNRDEALDQGNSWSQSAISDDSAKRTATSVTETRQDNSWMSGQIASSVDAIKKVSLNERKPKTKQKSAMSQTTASDGLSSSQTSIPLSGTVSTTSDVTLSLSGVSTSSKEQLQSGFRSYKSNQLGQSLYRATSTRNVRIFPGVVKRSNSCGSNRIEREKEKNEKVLQDFDGLLKWFSDYLGKEYKPSFGPRNSGETRDAHALEKTKAVLPKCSMSPLYFKFGVPENGVIRLC